MNVFKIIFRAFVLVVAIVVILITVAYQHYKGIPFVSPESNVPIVEWINTHKGIIDFISFLFWIILIYLIR